MPKHYAIGENAQYKTIEFNNTKVVDVTFDKAFDKKPMVQITPNDEGVMPVYKTNVSKTGVKIRFKTKWTGNVDVLILERDGV